MDANGQVYFGEPALIPFDDLERLRVAKEEYERKNLEVLRERLNAKIDHDLEQILGKR